MTTRDRRAPREAPSSMFCRLPYEILQEIIAYVAAFVPLEAKDLEEKRSKNIVQLGNLGKTKILWTYNQPDRPTLNSLQALSAVNKEMNRLCCSVLWQALRFPSTLPAPMSTWDGLMEKYGSNVKSLDLLLSTDWLAGPPARPYYIGPRKPIKKKQDTSRVSIIERDNLSASDARRVGFPEHDYHMRLGISRENVFRLLHHIPNLDTLHIRFQGRNPLRFDPEHAPRFELHLASLIAQTSGIRNFSIGTISAKIPASCIINTIKLLPHLQSFRGHYILTNASGSAKDFATALSKLKQLQRLYIGYSDVLDSSLRDYYPAAPNILELSVTSCSRFLMSQAPSFISAWTPQLTHLTLQPSSTYDLKDFNPNHHRFHLPSLTHLSMEHVKECDYLQCFQECHNITHLTYLDISPSVLSKFCDFVSLHFPRLKILITYLTEVYRSEIEEQKEYRNSMIPLGNFCQQKGIIVKFKSQV